MMNSGMSYVPGFLMRTKVLYWSSLICLTVCLRAAGQDTNPAQSAARRTVKLNALPLNHVRLTDGPLKTAQEADAKYLLELQPDRLLAFLRQHAGLKAKAEGYGGWDGPKRNLTGHIAGHYLSAVSLMWAATGDQRFKQRADYMVQELKEVQDKQGDGLLSALANVR